MSISCGWNFACSHTISQIALLSDYSVSSGAAWGSPLFYYFPCCLIEMVGIVFFLVPFVWVEFCLLTYHKPDDVAQRLLGLICCSLGVPFLYIFPCCLIEIVRIFFVSVRPSVRPSEDSRLFVSRCTRKRRALIR